MSKLIELREKCDGLYGQIEVFRNKANDKAQEFTAEDEVNFQRACDDYDATKEQIDAEERKVQESAQTRDALLARTENIQHAREQDRDQRRRIGRNGFPPSNGQQRGGEITNEHRGLSLRAWCFSRKRELTAEEDDACRRMGINPYGNEYSFDLCTSEQVNEGRARFLSSEFRTLSAHIGTSGAYTIPDGFVNSLETAMLHFGGMRQTSEVIRTDAGNTIPYPTANDTSNTGAIIAESTTVGQADPSFGVVNLYAHKYTSNEIIVPAELLEDSAFNIPILVGGWLGERLGRITNTHFTTGDGAAKPRGITTMTTLGKTAASNAAVTSDELLQLIDSLDEAYLVGASLMFQRSTLTAIRLLKDGNGRPLFVRGDGGAPDTIWEHPYTTNTDMPAIGASAKSILFGQLNKYKIREVRSVRLKRLVERRALEDQESFVAFMRYDGALIDAGTHPVKHLAHP